jgi:hypothetical protein
MSEPLSIGDVTAEVCQSLSALSPSERRRVLTAVEVLLNDGVEPIGVVSSVSIKSEVYDTPCVPFDPIEPTPRKPLPVPVKLIKRPSPKASGGRPSRPSGEKRPQRPTPVLEQQSQKILDALQLNPGLSLSALSGMTGMPAPNMRRALNHLSEKGKIRLEGKETKRLYYPQGTSVLGSP